MRGWLRRVPAITVAAGLAITACGGADAQAPASSPGTDQPVSISLESYLPVISPQAATTLNNLVADFQKAHPNIHVTVSSTNPGIAGLQREVVAGQAPDVTQQPFDGLKFMVSSLGAQNLDQVIGASAVKAAFGGEHPFVPPATQLGVVNGHVYGIPWTLSTPVLFYNADLFKAAGLDPAKPPATWQEVADAATVIKSKTGADGVVNGCFGAASVSGGAPSDWCLQAIIRSAGGNVLSGDGKSLTFTNPDTVNAARLLQPLGSAGLMVNMTSAQMIQAFGGGKLAMVLNTSALQGSLLTAAGGRFTILNTGMPAFPGHPVMPTNSGSALFILTKDHAKQQAAWELIKYLTGDAAETSISENIGYPPLRVTLADDSRYLKSWAHAQALLPANLNQLQKLVPWQAYPGSHYLQIETLINNAFSDVVFQQANPQQTLAQAQSQGQGLLT